ncbi:MAG: acetyltransferase [Chlamydiia bacterium]|nr:acetyltransferase [Chlamydiia bacterium]
MSKPLLLFFIIYVLAIPSIGAMENSPHKNINMRYDSMIQQSLQEANKNFFLPRSMQLDVLKNCPHVIPILAEWLYDEWHSYDSSLTKEKLIHSFKARVTSENIPITFVALKDNKPIGVISLKRQTDPIFRDFPEDAVWVGGLQVIPKERNQGVGQELLKFAQTIARQFGYETLYFYTSNPTNVRWYLKRGAQVIDNRPFRQHTITVMKIDCKI